MSCSSHKLTFLAVVVIMCSTSTKVGAAIIGVYDAYPRIDNETASNILEQTKEKQIKTYQSFLYYKVCSYIK